jgi:putative flippase GtrA
MSAERSTPAGRTSIAARLRADRRGRFLLFVLCGLASSAAYMGTLHVAVTALGWTALAAATAAFVVGTIVSYLLNAAITFAARMSRATALKFAAVTLVGLGLNLAITAALTRAGVVYWLTGLAVLIVVPVFNYLGHAAVTFSGKPQQH